MNNTIAECKWGPFDGEQWAIPDSKILIVMLVNGEHKVKITKLLRCGDLPKKYREDDRVLGWYGFVIEFSPGLPLMNNDTEWSTVAYHMWYTKQDQECEQELNMHEVSFKKLKSKPSWMLDGSDIDDMEDDPDPTDNWKRK